MQPTAERRPNPLRSGMAWSKVIALAAVFTLALSATLNWHSCWFFRNQLRDAAVLLYPFGWLALFFAIRTRWRFVLVAVTIPAMAVLAETGFWGISEMNAGAEASAVQALRQMQSSLNAYRVEDQLKEYPTFLPSVRLTSLAEKYYRFEYLPKRSGSGAISGYIIQATPTRRDCAFHRSFTIADDGRVFWTVEPRAAAPSDRLVE
jgi:hypothetical protein